MKLAQFIDGKKLAKQSEESLRIMMDTYDVHPVLVILTCNPDDASQVYLRNKEKAAKRIGIECRINQYDASIDTFGLIADIEKLNKDPKVSGIIIQLPLPPHLDVKAIQKAVSPEKDVDGFSPDSNFYACTPNACLRMLADYKIYVEGKHCVVIGRSEIVGKPLAKMLVDANATVTICHSKTPITTLATICKSADIVFSAAGVPGLIKPEYLKYGTTLIDISINRDPEGNLCGDAVKECENVCSYITPVPGGVGPMTVNTLMYHTVMAAVNTKKGG